MVKILQELVIHLLPLNFKSIITDQTLLRYAIKINEVFICELRIDFLSKQMR